MQKATVNSLRSHISEPRFGRYLAEAGNDPYQALKLYQWNIRASAAVVSSTGMVEVELRNSLDRALRQWNSSQIDPVTHTRYDAEWLRRPASPLRDVINPAGKERDVGKGKPNTCRDGWQTPQKAPHPRRLDRRSYFRVVALPPPVAQRNVQEE